MPLWRYFWMCPEALGTWGDLWQQAMAFLWQWEPQRCQETKPCSPPSKRPAQRGWRSFINTRFLEHSSGWMLNFRSDLTEISIFRERRYWTNYNRWLFSYPISPITRLWFHPSFFKPPYWGLRHKIIFAMCESNMAQFSFLVLLILIFITLIILIFI